MMSEGKKRALLYVCGENVEEQKQKAYKYAEELCYQITDVIIAKDDGDWNKVPGFIVATHKIDGPPIEAVFIDRLMILPSDDCSVINVFKFLEVYNVTLVVDGYEFDMNDYNGSTPVQLGFAFCTFQKRIGKRLF